MEEITGMFKAIGDRNRFRILKMLEKAPLCVCELKAVLGLAQSSISKHLKILKNAGLIIDEQEGFWTNYRLNGDGSAGCAEILSLVRECVNTSPVIVADRAKARAADRLELCCDGTRSRAGSEKFKVKNKKGTCSELKPDQEEKTKSPSMLDASSWLEIL